MFAPSVIDGGIELWAVVLSRQQFSGTVMTGDD